MITRYFIVRAQDPEWIEGPFGRLDHANAEVRRMIKSYRAPQWFYFINEETYPDRREGRLIPGWMTVRDVLTEEWKRTGNRSRYVA
jgi:hypothetical protein